MPRARSDKTSINFESASSGQAAGSRNIFGKMFSRALANLCTLALKESVTDRPCRMENMLAQVIQLRPLSQKGGGIHG